MGALPNNPRISANGYVQPNRIARVETISMNAASASAPLDLKMTMDGAIQIPTQNPLESIMSNIN